MEDWLKGILASGIFLLILYLIYLISISNTGIATLGASGCAFIGFIITIALTYSIEEDSFLVGMFIPVLVAVAILIGYSTKVPLPDAAYAVILAQLLALVLISESD